MGVGLGSQDKNSSKQNVRSACRQGTRSKEPEQVDRRIRSVRHLRKAPNHGPDSPFPALTQFYDLRNPQQWQRHLNLVDKSTDREFNRI